MAVNRAQYFKEYYKQNPRDPLRLRWYSIRQRCLDTNTENFKNYGGRGIDICKQWETFEGFKKDMGDTFKPNLTLDRIDNSKNYSKDNCRWVDMFVQNNNKRNNNLIEFNGIIKTIPQWAKILNIKRSTLSQRLYSYKWDVEKSFTTPIRERRANCQ